MKDFIKVFGVLSMGLCVAIFCYPLLHELGHTAAILLSGAKIYEFRLLPVAYVACDSKLNEISLAIIGVSGMLLPFVLSLFIGKKGFWLWLFSFYLKGISLLSFGISYIAVLGYESGIARKSEDIVKTIELSGTDSSFWLALMLSLFCLCAVIIAKSHPCEKFKDFFEL